MPAPEKREEQEAPRVFLSHAHEDKVRFVVDFAARLRAKGIDAWLDEWEMLPGDSLVDKIFEEGIKHARAIIIVLSENSVTSKWVREELNAAIVRKLETGTTLIPVIIDDCEVPEALRSTLWVEIADLDDYGSELDRIVSAIFNRREKPPLGKPPGYASILDTPITGLTRIDTRILKLFAEDVLKPAEFLVYEADTDPIWKLAEAQGIPENDFLDSLQVLSDKRYLKPGDVMSEVPPYYTLTLNGFQEYARSYLPDFDSLVTSVAALIVNEKVSLNLDIEERTGRSKTLIAFILRSMELRGYLKLYSETGGRITVSEVKPQLRRVLRETV